MKYAGRVEAVSASESPPSRGAWIEILCRMMNKLVVSVAPLAGGVD